MKQVGIYTHAGERVPNLAPMVDVVMCLIIFFMLATKLVERENSTIDLPVAPSAREQQKQDLGRRVVVNVVAAPTDGNAQYVIEQRPIRIDSLVRRLTAERQQDPAVKCVIRGDRELPYHTVEAVLLACARAGIGNVVFAAAREASPGER